MIGGFVHGEVQYNENYLITPAQDSPNSGGLRRTQVGFGMLGQRIYSKSLAYELKPKTVPEASFVQITLVSTSGALVGKIRTDIQYGKVMSLEFTLDEKGCADFILKLNSLPDFEILPFSIMQVRIGESDFSWYAGEVSYPTNLGTQRNYFEFRGYGLRNYLKGLKAFTTYSAGMDVSDVITDLVQTWVEPYSPIEFNASKIKPVTGVILANDIELGKYGLDKIFDLLAQMANCRWGVDGDKEFYFESRESSIIKTHPVGYTMTEFLPELNLAEVKNVIMVQRQQSLAEGGAGWTVAGIYNAEQSVKKFGRKEWNYQIPGYFSDADADVIGNALRDEFSEPRESADVKGFIVTTAESYIDRGRHRFLLPLDQYSEIFNEGDDADEWTLFNPSGNDLAVTLEENIIVNGLGSIKLNYTSGENSYAFLDCDLRGKLQAIRFYCYASKAGSYLSMGCGLTNFNENIAKVAIPAANMYFPVEWDISSLDLRRVKKFGFRIDEPGTVSNTSIYVDRLTIMLKGHKTYTLDMKRTKYRFDGRNQVADAEFGSLPPRMENYITSLIEQAQELKFTQEIK